MADSTPQKRVLPARERRESAAKRRATSPALQPAPTPNSTAATPSTEPRQKRKYTKRASLIRNDSAARASTSTPGVEDALPTRVSASKQLPTTRDKQPDNLTIREYQSYADSAILAASLFRSRAQWLHNGIFKSYWVKPTKRKGVIEQPLGNPDVKSMHKLGNATITIEPHMFDATFYVVREMTALPTQPLPHANQHTIKPAATSVPHVPQPVPRLPLSTGAPVQPERSGAATIKQEVDQSVKSEASMVPGPGPSNLPPVSMPAAAGAAAPAPAPTSVTKITPASGPPKPSDDPVIQMLAARAAADPRLKDLMKVVAASQATVEQLREFQTHIDEFNQVVKDREAKANLEGRTKQPPSQQPPQGPGPVPPSARMPPAPNRGPAPVGPAHLAYPPPLPPPPARPEAMIKHVIIEFHSSVSTAQGPSTDRWLFPEHAVLEMRASGMEMVVSFLAERSGAEILKSSKADDDGGDESRSKFQAGKQYYQPVTMLIKATQHRTIETIARAAKPLIEVQAHMKTVMKDKTRAPQEFLTYRLPRDKALHGSDMNDFADSGIDTGEGEDDELKDFYGM